MRVGTNTPSMIAQSALTRTNRELGTSIERLATGLRINRASDDAAGMGVSENLRSQIRGVAQASRNAQDGVVALQIAEGAANEVSDILQRMRELAIQNSSATLTSVERGYSQAEYISLRQEIDRISVVTNYNGMGLLSTASTRFGYSTAANGGGSALWIDAGNTRGSDSITISIATLTTASLGNVATSNISQQSSAITAISMLDSAINTVNSARANIGAYVNRLEHAINNLMVAETNQSAAESFIRDVDFATEMTKYSKEQILSQTSLAMLAQSNMLPSSVLGLLGK